MGSKGLKLNLEHQLSQIYLLCRNSIDIPYSIIFELREKNLVPFFLLIHSIKGHNGREGKGPGTSPSGWADAGSNPGVSKEG